MGRLYGDWLDRFLVPRPMAVATVTATALQLIIAGLSQGSIYALIALGMVILLRATTLLNFAHGEYFMLAALFTLILVTDLGVAYALAVIVALVAVIAISVAIEKVTFQPLINAPHFPQVMATIAVLFILRGAVRYYQYDARPLPPITPGRVDIAGVSVSPQYLWSIGTLLVMTAIFTYVFRRTEIGRIMRASTQSLRGCALVGINVKRVFTGMWAFGATLAGIAGILAAPFLLVSADVGNRPLLLGFAGMTLGGFGSIPGAIVGGLIIGLIEVNAAFYVSTRLGDVAGFAIILAVLILKPRGLFGTSDVT